MATLVIEDVRTVLYKIKDYQMERQEKTQDSRQILTET